MELYCEELLCYKEETKILSTKLTPSHIAAADCPLQISKNNYSALPHFDTIMPCLLGETCDF